jgi:hypothetical protein
LSTKVDEQRFLEAMGFETLAVNDVRRDISRRHEWLHSAKKMTDTVVEDYEDWCKLRS